MPFTDRTKISEYDANAADNINLGTATSPAARLGEYGVNLDAEAMRPSDTNGALRELMAHLKAMDAGTSVLTSPKAGQFLLDTTYSENGNEAQGSIFWNSDELTANLVQNGTILQVGQEIQINVRNSTVSDIADGSAVMATGTLGASGRITIGLMDASSAANAKMFIGIATETITAGGDGKVTWFGKVRDINTSGFTQPSILWCDPATAGGLTETQPSAPNAKLAVAYVIYSDTAQNGGTIFVRGTPGQLLSECHDVQISGTPADNEVLAYDTTTGAFINQTAAEAGIAALSGATFTGQVTLPQGQANSLSLEISGTTGVGLYNTGGGLALAVGTSPVFIAYADEIRAYQDVNPVSNGGADLGGASLRWNSVYAQNVNVSGTVDVSGTFSVATNVLKVDTVNSRVGVNTTSPTFDFEVTGSAKISSGLTINGPITEEVVALSGTSVALNPNNGTIQTHTLTGATTYTDGLAAGHSVTLHITAGGNGVTWPTIAEWFGTGGASTAPTLSTSGVTVVVLWKVGSSLYGLLSGAN